MTPSGVGKGGQIILPERKREVAALGDLHRIGERLGEIGKRRRHLGLRLEILVGREALGAARIGEHVALGDAHARLVRAVAVRPQKLNRGASRRPAAPLPARARPSPPRARRRRRGRHAAPRGKSGLESALPMSAPPFARRCGCPAAAHGRYRRRVRRTTRSIRRCPRRTIRASVPRDRDTSCCDSARVSQSVSFR